MRIGAIFGLGLAYSGSNRAEIIQLLLPVLADATIASNMEVIGVTALALGLISVASCNEDVTTTFLQTLMEKSALELKEPFSKYGGPAVPSLLLFGSFHFVYLFTPVHNLCGSGGGAGGLSRGVCFIIIIIYK